MAAAIAVTAGFKGSLTDLITNGRLNNFPTIQLIDVPNCLDVLAVTWIRIDREASTLRPSQMSRQQTIKPRIGTDVKNRHARFDALSQRILKSRFESAEPVV